MHLNLNHKQRKENEVGEFSFDLVAPKKNAKSRKKKAKSKEPVDPNAPPRPKRKTGLDKPLLLSPALFALVGEAEVLLNQKAFQRPLYSPPVIQQMSRPKVVKKVWSYIKDNNLQDPADRRFILCDEKLKGIFNMDRVNGFTMNKYLSEHLTNKTPNDSSSDKQQIKAEPTDEVDTSPAVTAETPDVVTPKEGENMLSASASATVM